MNMHSHLHLLYAQSDVHYQRCTSCTSVLFLCVCAANALSCYVTAGGQTGPLLLPLFAGHPGSDSHPCTRPDRQREAYPCVTLFTHAAAAVCVGMLLLPLLAGHPDSDSHPCTRPDWLAARSRPLRHTLTHAAAAAAACRAS
jgi:hypothetical protein